MNLKKRACAGVLFFLCFAYANFAYANPFLSGKPEAPLIKNNFSFLNGALANVLNVQSEVQHTLSQQFYELVNTDHKELILIILLLGFAYGVFHILAPGHSKSVVVAWFLGNNARWRDGAFAAMVMTVGHTITAVLLVSILKVMLGLTSLNVMDKVAMGSIIGYAIITFIGAHMLWRLLRHKKEPMACGCGHTHIEAPANLHAEISTLPYTENHFQPQPTPQPQTESHIQRHDHSVMGHQISVDPHPHTHEVMNSQIDAPKSGAALHRNPEAMSIFLAASLVPCTGSMLFLLVAMANNLFWVGVLAVLAIAGGMWLTLTLIGTFAIFMRSLLNRGRQPAPWRLKCLNLLSVMAALFVFLFGLLFFISSAQHFFV